MIIGLILKEAFLIALVGLSLGAFLLNQVKDKFPRRVIIQLADCLFLAGVVIFVCLLASSLGVRLALKIDPAEALGS